jgi:hypothetical protein
MIIGAVTKAFDLKQNILKRKLRLSIACTLALAATQTPVLAADGNFFTDTKPIIDIRLRQEQVEQVPFANDADAVTLRARLGFETGQLLKTSLLAEGEVVEALVDEYNDTIPPHADAIYPVVTDPESGDLNRLHLTSMLIPKTTVTIGRQRINLDDQRFIGNSGWRQIEQTFNAARIVNKGVKNLTIDATYLNRVNRIFGEDSPAGRYDLDGFLGNISYQTKAGKITVFNYVLDFEPPPAPLTESTNTLGARFAGETPAGSIRFIYAASYAQQSDYGDNPLDFDNSYYLGEFGIGVGVFSVVAGLEVLEGDGVKGFSTPLATLHKFQGWADKFLATPANGLEDKYLNLGLSFKKVGFLDSLGMAAIYHEYESQNVSADYGNEINLQLQAKWKRFSAMLKYADYEIDVPVAGLNDTTKLWAQIEFIW